MSKIKYFVTQGFKGVISNSLMSLLSICIVTASMMLLGIFIIIGANLNGVTEQIQEQCQINVYLPHGADVDDFRSVRSGLEELDNVKEVIPYTKEERFKTYKENYYQDEADVVDTLASDNPLRDSCILVLEDINKAAETIEAASKVKGVEEVKNSLDLINKVVAITNTVRHVTLWFILGLMLISIFIISNTIKLGMVSRQKEIQIMRYVGATNWFIRWPFIVEGMILGFMGSFVAAVIVLLGYGAFVPSIREFMDPIVILGVPEMLKTISIGFLLVGTVIGVVGSITSIRKYLEA
ncbi:MAG: permease-like cell division protein FtsX [Clostridia bacterium]|nr:permease-like cell division protein FtsX [Clostridia bacterium]